APAVGIDVAKHPYGGGPVVCREQRVLCCVLVDDLGQVGAGNRGVRARHRFGPRRCAIFLESFAMACQKRAVVMLLEARQQSVQGRLDVADGTDGDRVASATSRRPWTLCCRASSSM